MTREELRILIKNTKEQAQCLGEAGACGVCGTKKCWLEHSHDARPCIDSAQAASLAALISYLACATGQHEVRVERTFSNHFCIPNPHFLPQDLYETAIGYIARQVSSVH